MIDENYFFPMENPGKYIPAVLNEKAVIGFSMTTLVVKDYADKDKAGKVACPRILFCDKLVVDCLVVLSGAQSMANYCRLQSATWDVSSFTLFNIHSPPTQKHKTFRNNISPSVIS